MPDGGRRNLLVASIAAALVMAVGTGSAHAVSAGCAALATQDWDFSGVTAGSITVPRGPFDVGDVIELTASGSSGTARVMDSAFTTAVISISVSSSPQTQTYTVPTAGTYTLSVLSPVNFTSSARCVTPPPPDDDEASYDRAVTKAFLLSRINGMLLNSPGAMSLVNRDGAAAGRRGVATSLVSNGFQISTSLSGLRRSIEAADERLALAPGDEAGRPLAFETASPWELWAEGRYSHFSDDAGNLDREGYVGLLYAGGDYRVARNMIVGVMAQFDWAEDDSDTLGSSVDGKGWMLGPYLSMRVHENVYFDLRGAWGRSDNDLAIGATTGSFDTSRWLLKGTLAGNWTFDAWRLTPAAEVAYVTESQESFTNSAGVFVAGQDVSLGRLQFGPEVGYRFALTAGTFIESFAAIKGVWDWDNPNVAIIGGSEVGPGDLWGRVEGGLNLTTSNGWRVRGLASWDGLGSNDYSGYTLQGIVSVPLN